MIIRMVATQSSVGTLARERLARKTANRPQHLAPPPREAARPRARAGPRPAAASGLSRLTVALTVFSLNKNKIREKRGGGSKGCVDVLLPRSG